LYWTWLNNYKQVCRLSLQAMHKSITVSSKIEGKIEIKGHVKYFSLVKGIANFYLCNRGRFLVNRELSAILDVQLFPTFLRPNDWSQKSWKRSSTFCRALWAVKVNLLVKKFGAMELNYIYVQEIDPWWKRVTVLLFAFCMPLKGVNTLY
jgi:hypothetical protein